MPSLKWPFSAYDNLEQLNLEQHILKLEVLGIPSKKRKKEGEREKTWLSVQGTNI